MAAKRKSGNRKVKRAMHEMKRGKLKSGRCASSEGWRVLWERVPPG